jgi:aryl-alcohol dehydrogenase-like predicted oxidoreductase
VTALDTAYNYQRFDAHRALSEAAGSSLESFEISTKVGFFPDGHSLEPARLQAAVEQAVVQLGRAPDTVLLHNPECSPLGFQRACGMLAGLRDAGLCGGWGLSTWDPRPLLTVADDARPDVLMVRAGLTVPAAVLDASEQLAAMLQPEQLWGMAPFGGSTAYPIWTTVDMGLFLEPGQWATRLAAGLAVAFAVPRVERIAVGTSRPAHLPDLVAACGLATSARHVANYRDLLRRRASVNVGT